MLITLLINLYYLLYSGNNTFFSFFVLEDIHRLWSGQHIFEVFFCAKEYGRIREAIELSQISPLKIREGMHMVFANE